MDISLLKILFYVLGFQFLFVSLFLFQNKKGKTLSNRLLGVVFLMVFFAVINLYFIVFRIQISTPHLLFIDDTFMLAYGPLLFLFTQSVLFKNYKIGINDWVHFAPFILSIFVVILILIFVDKTTVSKATSDINNQQIPTSFRIVEVLILVHIFYYLYRSKLEIKNVLDKVMDMYSTFNQDNFKLLKFILNSFIIIFLLSLIHSALPFIGIKNGLLITFFSLIIFMFYFINSILLKILNQSSNESGTITQTHFKEKEKYAGSKLTEIDLKNLKEKLDNHVMANNRFLDSELSINDLSVELDMSLKMVSQVINEGYACNFYDFINRYRIEAAKTLFINQVDKKLTIQEVMYDTGFNSKSSFNTAFKKFTNLTPTQFKNTLKKSSTS